MCSSIEHTGSKADIVEGQLGNPGVKLEEQRQWLSNTAGSAENGDLGVLHALESTSIHQTTSMAPRRRTRCCPRKSKRGGGNTAECAYLAGRHREGAALGLGECLPGSEHCVGDGVWRR